MTLKRNLFVVVCVAFVFGLGVVTRPVVAAAEDYPSKPITIVVGYPPGGSTAMTAQLFAEHAKKYLPKSQPILINYKPGD